MKRKISKVIAVLIAILTLLTQAIPVMALTEGNKYSYTETYLDAYYDTGEWQTADGHTHHNKGQVCLRNLKSTGEPLYCIQIYKDCTGADAIATNIEDTNIWKYELSDVAKKGMTLVSIYGYRNYNYGYSWKDAQLATNVLLWEFEMSKRGQFGYTDPSYFAEDIFRNYPDARSCYKKIIEACANHQNRPSFSNEKVVLKGTGSSNSVTLTDSNYALGDFNVRASNNRIKASISGNKLTVYATGEGSLSGRLIFTKKNTDTNSAFALTGANQTLFYGTIPDPVTAPLSIELSFGNLKIVKTSEDGQIADKEFHISGNGINKDVKTNSSGEFVLSELQEGEYTVTEKVDGQYKLQDAQKVKVTAGSTATVTFNNILTKGVISLTKTGDAFVSTSYVSTSYDEETKIYQPVYDNVTLSDAVYEVYANEDITNGSVFVAKDTLVDTITTDEYGAASTKPLYLNADGSAEYRIKEITAPYGYVLDTEEYIVTLTRAGANLDASSQLELTDERQKVNVEFTKTLETDELFGIGNNDEINKVTFGLYASEDITAADETFIPADGLIEAVTVSDIESGTFKVNTELPEGKYYLKEIAADEHYIIRSEQYDFEVKYTNQNEPTVNIVINEGEEITNDLKRGSIKGVKVDNNGKKLEGALIGLFPDGTTEFTKETALMTATSAKDGAFSFSNIPIGKYIVKEIESPEGYILDDKSYDVEITDDEQVIQIEIVNTLKIGKMTLSYNDSISPKTGADDIAITIAFTASAIIAAFTVIISSKRRRVKK